MPVFQEKASSARDLRILPSRAAPLPRLTPRTGTQTGANEKYEVVVIGVRTCANKRLRFTLFVTNVTLGWPSRPLSHIVLGQIWPDR
jgi:hypothetical protein